MAGRDERVCVRAMTDVPKVNVKTAEPIRPKILCITPGKVYGWLKMKNVEIYYI